MEQRMERWISGNDWVGGTGETWQGMTSTSHSTRPKREKLKPDDEQFWDDMDYLQNYLASVTSKGYPSVIDFLNTQLDEQDTTPFTHAIKHNKVNALRCMLKFLGSEREEFLLTLILDDDEYTTPFTYAMKWNKMDAFRCMIKSIDSSKRELFLNREPDHPQGISLFIYAIKYDKKEALRCMLAALSYSSRVSLLRSRFGETGDTPIMFAVDCNNTWALNCMLTSMTRDGDLISLLNYKLDDKGTSHFVYALKSNVEAMGTMLRNVNLNDRISLLTRPDKRGTSPVAYAARWNKRNFLLCMLDLVEEETRMRLLSNRTVFFHSVSMNNVELVQCMLNRLSLDNRVQLLSMDDDGFAPFVYAIKDKRKEMIGAMLESVDFDGRLSLLTLRTNNSYFSLPPFNHVLINDQLECFRLIMEVLRPEDRVVLLNLPIEDGSAKTCLTYACEQDCLSILLHITELGVPVQSNGMLCLCCRWNNVPVQSI